MIRQVDPDPDMEVPHLLQPGGLDFWSDGAQTGGPLSNPHLSFSTSMEADVPRTLSVHGGCNLFVDNGLLLLDHMSRSHTQDQAQSHFRSDQPGSDDIPLCYNHPSSGVDPSLAAPGMSTSSYQDSTPGFSTQWQLNSEEPYSMYSLTPANVHPHKRRRPNPLVQVDELSIWSPSDFVANLSATSNESTQISDAIPSTSPTTTFQQGYARSPPQQFLDRQMFANLLNGQTSPGTSMTGELTTGSSLFSGMSRQDSFKSFNSFSNASDMMRLRSDMSSDFESGYLDDSLSRSSPVDVTFMQRERYSFSEVDEKLLSSTFPSRVSSRQCSQLSLSPPSPVKGMSRSASCHSTQTNLSNCSAQSRSSRRREEQLVQSARPIAPKQMNKDTTVMQRHSSSNHEVIRIETHNGTTRNVAPIPKTPYIRPPRPKLMCNQCDEHPDGFRGDHELRRHVERLHSVVKKMWVTVDASPNKDFLSSCKLCRTGKKYGANYNVAAHLRRTHFHPKPKKPKANGDKGRGGMGGGNDPPMDVLKHWMKEVEVTSESVAVAVADADAGVGVDEETSDSPMEVEQISNSDGSVPALDHDVDVDEDNSSGYASFSFDEMWMESADGSDLSPLPLFDLSPVDGAASLDLDFDAQSPSMSMYGSSY